MTKTTDNIETPAVDPQVQELQTTIEQLQQELAERKALETHYRHQIQQERRHAEAQKLEALGLLAGGMAHDFNNMLFTIISYAQMGKKKVPPAEKAFHFFERILVAGEQAKGTMEQILTFSHKSKLHCKPIKLTDVLEESLPHLRSSLPQATKIETNFPNIPHQILGDAKKIQQVLLELGSNAAFALQNMEGQMRVSIELLEIPIGEDLAQAQGLEEKQHLRITFQDSGCGIEPQDLNRVFEPFFTTRPAGEGAGMGLAMVHGIVRAHGGAITVNSVKGQGTTFQAFFPTIPQQTITERDGQVAQLSGCERILLIDDQQLVLEMVDDRLSDLGYHVTSIQQSTDALETFRVHPEQFDLVVTDQSMPQLTGAELTEALIEIRPDIPIILISGFSDTINHERAQAIGTRAFLQKPLADHQLELAIRRILDASK